MKKIKNIFAVCALLALITLIGVGIAVANRISDRSVISLPSGTSEDGAMEIENEICNILFLGLDKNAGLCDVMMLVGLDLTDGEATVAQIPRDTYAAYTPSSYKKLNGAYSSLGGAEQAAEFIGDAFGIEIHHYACIGLDTFSSIVDAVGGVDIELTRNMYYSDPEQGLYINLKKGQTHLDGEMAQQFVRYRSGYADGDLGRIDAQKLFMAAFFERIAKINSPLEVLKLSGALDGVETDLGISDMLSLGGAVLDMNTDSIRMMTLPGEEATALESGASYYVLSREANAEIAKEYFGATSEFDSDKKFLNVRYESFEKIYNSNVPYRVMPIKDIATGKEN